jgi:hypothetical protein
VSRGNSAVSSAVNSRVGTPKLNGTSRETPDPKTVTKDMAKDIELPKFQQKVLEPKDEIIALPSFKPIEKVIEKPFEKVVETPVEKVVEKVEEKEPVVEDSLEKAVEMEERPIEKVVEKEEKPIEKAVEKEEKPVEKVVEEQKPVKKIVEKQKPVEKIVEKQKPLEKIVEKEKPVDKVVEKKEETKEDKPTNKAEKGEEKHHGSHHHHKHSETHDSKADKKAESIPPITTKPTSPNTPESATSSPKTMGRRSLLRISPAQLEAAAAANERARKTGSSAITPSPTPTSAPTSATSTTAGAKKDKNKQITVEEMREMLASKSFKSNKQIEFQAELAKTKEKLSALGITEPVSWASPLAKETAKKAAEMGDIVALAGISVRTGTVVEMTPLSDDLANARAAQDEIYDMNPEDLLAHVAAKLEEREKREQLKVEMPSWLQEKVISLRKPDGSVFECPAKDLVLYLQRDHVENLVKQEVKKHEKEESVRREQEAARAKALEESKRQEALKQVPPPRGSSSRTDAPKESRETKESKESKDKKKSKPAPVQAPVSAPAPEPVKEEKKKGLSGLFKKMSKK